MDPFEQSAPPPRTDTPGSSKAGEPAPTVSGSASGPAGAPVVPDYELLRRIGKGAYGEVWIARNRATDVLRAAKIVWRHTFEDDRPFQREFEGIQKFERISREHPSQLALFHIGRNEPEGYFYYVMELADAATNPNDECRNPKEIPSPNVETEPSGQPLRASEFGLPSEFDPALRDHSSFYSPHTLRADIEKGRLPATRVLEIGLALSEALGHLHSHGLVHRDVKPSNVVFVNGRPKLADIGLVTDVGDGRSIVGTEGYLPPEGPGTPQADIFALGKVLYEAATGLDRRQLPQLPADLRAWQEAKPILELNEILLKACAADPRQRYPSAESVYADLAILKCGQSIRHLRAVERRLKILTKAGAVAGVCAVIGAGIFFEAIRQRQVALRSLVRLHVSNGTRLMDEGDLFGALLSFTEALRRDAGNSNREECHRIRIASVLRDCPKLVGIFAHSNAPINQAAFSPDGRRLVTASDDHTAGVWDLATGAQQFSLAHDRGMVFSAAFSPDGGRLIATTSSDNLVHLWNSTNGQALTLAPIRHRGQRIGPHPRFSPQGERLLTLTNAQTLCIWSTITGEMLGQPMRHEQEVSAFAFSPEGRRILAIGKGDLMRVWDAFTGDSIPPFGAAEAINAAEFSPDGDVLAIGGEDRRLRLYDLRSGKLARPPLAHRDSVISAQFSPEGGRLATACWDRTVALWDLAAGEEIIRPLQHSLRVFRADFSPDGGSIATASDGNRVRFWDADTGELLAPLFIHNVRREPVTFSPDGQLMLTVRRDVTLDREEVAVVWSFARMEVPALSVRPVASYRPITKSDGGFKSIITGDRISAVDRSGKPLTKPLAQVIPFRQAYFGADHRLLLTESADGRGRVWDLSAGEPLTPLWKIAYVPNASEPSKETLPHDGRPVEDLVKLAQLLSGSRVDENGGFRPLEKNALLLAWDSLKRNYGTTFMNSEAEVLAWHDQQARACEQAWNWWPAVFHLKSLAAAKPGDPGYKGRLAYAAQALACANTSLPSYIDRRRVIPPRNPLFRSAMIDLTAYHNGTDRIRDGVRAILPSGLQVFAGTAFDLRGVVTLSGPKSEPAATDLPQQVLGIRIDQKCRRLHFLHAAGAKVEDGTDVISYELHYADHDTKRITFVYGHQLRSWWTAPEEPLEADESIPVWLGSNPREQGDAARCARIFKSTWENQRPEVAVTSVDFISRHPDAGPFLVAITAE